jgi:hypothetical protein
MPTTPETHITRPQILWARRINPTTGTELDGLQPAQQVRGIADAGIARDSSDSRITEMGNHGAQDIGIRNSVRIHDEDQLAARAKDGVIHGHGFAFVDLLIEQANAGVFHQGANPGGRPVAGPVVDDDDLKVGIVDLQSCAYRGPDDVFLAKRGNDHGNKWQLTLGSGSGRRGRLAV